MDGMSLRLVHGEADFFGRIKPCTDGIDADLFLFRNNATNIIEVLGNSLRTPNDGVVARAFRGVPGITLER